MIVVCDIDGCIVDPCKYVERYLLKPKKDWSEYYKHTLEFEKVGFVLGILDGLWRESDVYFVTGRPESNRELTLLWFRHNTPFAIGDGHLLMRPKGDYRRTYNLKLEWYEKLKPDLIIEDEPETIAAAVFHGFTNILQVYGHRQTERDGTPGEQGEVLV